MKTGKTIIGMSLISLMSIALLIFMPGISFSHCDTMDGPVITDAKLALEKDDVSIVLKWVNSQYETEVRDAFENTMAVRILSQDAKDLADMFFFETLVRFHRAGEGAPYTGIKPAGSEMNPAVIESDSALNTGSVDKLLKMIIDVVSDGLKKHFSEALENGKHKDESVEKGREFVESYIKFIHYAERLYNDATSEAIHQEGEGEGVEEGRSH